MGALQLSKLSIKSSVRNYEVYFSKSIVEIFEKEINQNDFFIIDEKVYGYLSPSAKKIISSNNILKVEASERNKAYDKIESIIKYLIQNNFRRSNRIVAIGGGITQDIAGFVSSIIYRGVTWIFFPTTLLAQADSCIGGKTSINIGNYKNQLGNFYPPKKIFIIPEFTNSLSPIDFKSGMGEMLHFYLVSNEKNFSYYVKNYDNAFKDNEVLLNLIKRNLSIKKDFIEIDEFDKGPRLVLNYGHSFGHVIENLSNYSIPHGIAVSYGMDIANFISFKLEFIDNKLYSDLKLTLKKIWKGISLPDIDVKQFEKALSKDKKNIGNSYQLILTKGIGNMFIHGINPNDGFTNWLTEYFLDNKANV